ncbi:hypothetical protein ACHQM5_023004 [Ranunculus cassubicifolius]
MEKQSTTTTTAEQNLLLGMKPAIVIGICIGCIFIIVVSMVVCLLYTRKQRISVHLQRIPTISKEIIEIKATDQVENSEKFDNVIDIGASGSVESSTSGDTKSSTSTSVSADIPNIGWGQWYSLRELQIATNGFSAKNVIGEGGYGIVYKGILPDNSVVAVKNLLNKKGQAEKEFKVEVEAIGKVRHKNLASLIGYCADGAQRMLVYEYLDNGNLEQWLHGDLGRNNPLTWDIRIKIAVGTAKGLAYLHEGLEPKVIHRDVKSSNILLDKKWNARVSDFGLAKLLGSDASYVTTRVMGTFGCVAPEYANTGMLSEGSDVYSFGVLLMEIISGRSPVDYARPTGEVNMVDWFKGMVASRRGEEVVDPAIKVLPSTRALKRALLVCLRCLDLDANKRPKMGQVVHMLEGEEFPFRNDNRAHRDADLPSHEGPTVTSKIYYSAAIAGAR